MTEVAEAKGNNLKGINQLLLMETAFASAMKYLFESLLTALVEENER